MSYQAARASADVLATTQPSPNAEETFVRFLTPTDNKRLNELIGFLCITLAVLTGLALLTYQPSDISFNVSGPASGAVARNWIGPVGAYSADFLFPDLRLCRVPACR